ncbi:hypothetical protein Nhal_2795 [Nitrosococcus halophilus Nc 4]|uniref:Uncharacterized protein n=1 Tax=Nitrosococcus halophilus (strain Nc4) TaxID=472759 RepID=D5BXV0_NITHN|nr:hypothetical protein Nhal_2795 [Nitrosococcus halophilus Nc 4]
MENKGGDGNTASSFAGPIYGGEKVVEVNPNRVEDYSGFHLEIPPWIGAGATVTSAFLPPTSSFRCPPFILP